MGLFDVKVGQFNEKQLLEGVDKIEIEKFKLETKLKYVNSKRIKIKGKLFLEVWLGDDFKI